MPEAEFIGQASQEPSLRKKFAAQRQLSADVAPPVTVFLFVAQTVQVVASVVEEYVPWGQI